MSAALLALATGCGGEGQQTVDEKKDKDKTPPAASTTTVNTPVVQAPAVPAKPPADPWQLDPANHVFPDSPVSGRLMKSLVKPETMLVGDTLSFQVPTENGTPTDVTIRFGSKQLSVSDNKLVIRPETPAGPEVPEVIVTIPGQPNPVQYPFMNGYALTLELGKKQNGRVPGKVYLVLPDEDRSYLAGTFETEWQRTPDMPPNADDAPFVQGKVTVPGAKDPIVKLGCIGVKTDGSLAVETVETVISGMAGWSKLNNATLFASGRYELVRLFPGRVFVYAITPNGAAAWKWLTIEPSTQQTFDLALDTGATGSLEVTLPEEAMLSLAPADDKQNSAIAAAIGLSIGQSKKAPAGKTTFEKLIPGTYEVWGEEKLGTVEVKRGETAKLEVPKK